MSFCDGFVLRNILASAESYSLFFSLYYGGQVQREVGDQAQLEWRRRFWYVPTTNKGMQAPRRRHHLSKPFHICGLSPALTELYSTNYQKLEYCGMHTI